MRNWFPGAGLILMVACSGAETTGNIAKDSIRIQTATLGTAIIGEPYSSSITVLGGVVPYVFRIADGKLPPGITFSGGSLSGTPTEKGSFTFTIEVTDANLSSKVQKYTISVTDKPPPELSLELPGTPVKALTRVPVFMRNGERVAAGRLTLTLPEGLTVKGVDGNKGKPLIIWNVKKDVLTVDFAFSQKFFRESRVLFLHLESSKETGVLVPSLSSSNYDLRDVKGTKLAATDLLTPPPPALKPEEQKVGPIDPKVDPKGDPKGDPKVDPKKDLTDPAKTDPVESETPVTEMPAETPVEEEPVEEGPVDEPVQEPTEPTEPTTEAPLPTPPEQPKP